MLLKVESLTKRFGGLVAVDSVDMQVPEGSIVGVVGPNGAGKSTLFNLISGQLKPDSGRMTFEGREITGCKPYRISRMGIGRTFQTATLFEELPVKYNLAIAYKMRTHCGFWDAITYWPREKRAREQTALKVAETLGVLGLVEVADTSAGSIPQIAKKKLAIGMALIGEPRLVLLDEPTAGVGVHEVSEVIGLIEGLREKGTAVCIIEHKMRVIMGLADKVVVLNFGKKIAEGSPKEVSGNPEVIEAYLGSGYNARA